MFRALILLTLYIYYVHPANGFDKESPLPTNEEQYQTPIDENKIAEPCNEDTRRIIPGLVNPSNQVEQDNNNEIFKTKYPPGTNIPETIPKTKRDLLPGVLGKVPIKLLQEVEQNKQQLSVNPTENISPNARVLRGVDQSENYHPTWRSLPGNINSPTNRRPLVAHENRHLSTRDVNKEFTSDNISTPHVYRYDKRRDVENINKFPYESNFESSEDDDDSDYSKHELTCYACNSLSDSSCWNPNKNTRVKYCKKKQKVCLRMTYNERGSSYVVRDCGKKCPKDAESCTACSSDLCNSAPLTITNIGATIAMVFVTFLIKY